MRYNMRVFLNHSVRIAESAGRIATCPFEVLEEKNSEPPEVAPQVRFSRAPGPGIGTVPVIGSKPVITAPDPIRILRRVNCYVSLQSIKILTLGGTFEPELGGGPDQ